MQNVTKPTTLIFVAHWIIVIALSIRVIMRRLSAGVSLAWLAVVFSVPFVGALIYLLIGENRIGDKYQERTARIHDIYSEWQRRLRERASLDRSTVNGEVKPLQYHAEAVVGFPPMQGNQLKLMDDFRSVFESIIADLDRAKRTCHFEFYIWHVGGMADQVAEALIRASERGVVCRVLVDAIGSKPFLRSKLAQRLRDSGIQLVASLPVGLIRILMRRADLRNHRKIIVIDGEIAYTGSQNLVDPRFFKQDEGVGQWIDAMVRTQGPSVEALGGTFIEDWQIETGEGLTTLETTSDIHSVTEKGPSAVQVVPSGPAFRPETIHQLLLAVVYTARKELVLTTPYFVPDDALLTALISAAHRGVEVTIVVPSEVDSRLVHYASRSLFDDLLAAGVGIASFKGGLLHTKSITVDGKMCVFGSVNLDMRSLWLDFEISLFVYDPDFTIKLRAMQTKYIEDSEMMNLIEWRRRPSIQRFIENAAHLIGPLL
ncbi:MAG: cardiolipin synthase [Desulfobacteria bacterium]